MRITGTQHTVGTIHICENYRSDAPVELTEVQGILISTGDKETHEAMCNLISSTVDIYPHPVNGLVAGECTPENYAHALARLAHAEDHLAREVRSSQALLSARSNQARDAAWSEYLDLRKQIRKVVAEGRTDSEEQRTLVARALSLARLHNFDPPTRALEEAQARIDLAVDVLATAYYTDGAHHKQWVADQALRALLGDRYDAWADERVDGGALASELTGTAP